MKKLKKENIRLQEIKPAPIRPEIIEEILPKRTDFIEQIVAISATHKTMCLRVADLLRPALIELFRNAPKMNYDQLAAIVPQTNQLLNDYHLTFMNPETGLPAKLYVNRARPNSSAATLELADTRRGRDGRQRRVAVRKLDLDKLDLVEVDHEKTPEPKADLER